MAQSRILCVSFDGAVSDMRSAALRKAGYAVTPIIKVPEAMDLLAREQFDLVIIGHRFSREEKLGLAKMAKEDCGTSVLLVQSVEDKSIPADSRVYALDGTAGLLNATKVLLSKRKAAGAG